MSMLCSSAILRARGDGGLCPSMGVGAGNGPLARAWTGSRCCSLVVCAGCCCAAIAVLLLAVDTPVPSPISPSTSPTATTSPSFLSTRCSTPLCSALTSTFTLSVSSSTSTSPCWTASPSCLSHFAITASTMDSPNAGTRISVDMFAYLSKRIDFYQGAPRGLRGEGKPRPYSVRPHPTALQAQRRAYSRQVNAAPPR